MLLRQKHFSYFTNILLDIEFFKKKNYLIKLRSVLINDFCNDHNSMLVNILILMDKQKLNAKT